MVLRFLFVVSLFLINQLYAQIGENDFDDLQRFENNLGRSIDTTYSLSGNVKLVFSHNAKFRLIHFIDSLDEVHLIEWRYRNVSGYTRFYQDQSNYIILAYWGNGSGNKPFYFRVNKEDGIIEYL